MRFLRRVLNMLVVLLFVSLLMFVLVRVLPGDPVGAALGDGATKEQVEKFRAQMGMDKPLQVQYLVYLRGLLDGHFGVSLVSRATSVTSSGSACRRPSSWCSAR